MEISNPEIFQIHAEFCKTLANPKRLMILAILAKKEMNVGELVEITGTNPANVSQHLRMLREKNMVQARKEGQMVYYRLTDHRLVEACNLIRSVLLEDLKKRGMIAQEIEIDNLVTE